MTENDIKRNCSQIKERMADETCLEQGIAPCLYCDGHDSPPHTIRKVIACWKRGDFCEVCLSDRDQFDSNEMHYLEEDDIYVCGTGCAFAFTCRMMGLQEVTL